MDVLIYAIGYESRSAIVASTTRASFRIGISFAHHRVHSFEKNLIAAQDRHDQVISESQLVELDMLLADIVSKLNISHPAPLKVVIDVSSMTTSLMSSVFSIVLSRNVALKVAYAPAVFQPPASDSGPFMRLEPVVGNEGWTSHPEWPLSLILGLGYEADMAIGTVEYLDPSGVWAFVPRGEDVRFWSALQYANRDLWQIVSRPHRLPYRIDVPHLAYYELRGLVGSLAQRSRVVLVPGGPKIFSAMCILARREIGDEVSIWRASSHGHNPVREVAPAGNVIFFDYNFPRPYAAVSSFGDDARAAAES